MSFPSSNQWTPIFVSFIGDDVREGFISPLFEQLKRAGIDYFSHKDTQDAGLITASLFKARFALVVFHEGYANTTKRRLDVLVEILNHKRYRKLVVIPIFCMDRAAVVGDGEFTLALQTVVDTEKNAKKMEWRRALAEAEEISGYELRAANDPPLSVIPFDYPLDYLTSISGYMGKDGTIKSLTFYGNKGRIDSWGKVEDDDKVMYFWYPSTGSRITGFRGRCGETLNSIGVYAEPIPYMYPFKFKKPLGGPEPYEGLPDVAEWDDGGHTNVRAFRVTTCGAGEEEKIESITFKYDDNGFLVEGFRRGGGDPSSGEWIWLDSPSERLTSISIWTGRYRDKTIITHLKLTSNRGNSHDEPYGPYPNTRRTSEEHSIKIDGDDKIVGFFGKKGESHLISIGVHLEEIKRKPALPPPTLNEGELLKYEDR